MKPNNFILDVDGTLTADYFIYSKKGKQYKIFGPDDADALKILKKYINISFVSADRRGFDISKKRIIDMGFKIFLVKKDHDRLKWLKKNFDLKKLIYMGDSFTDIPIFKNVHYSLAPKNSFFLCKKYVNYITQHESGSRSVAEASNTILKKFFKSSLLDNL
jgi:3-deoxy-D-manno-octulosonate 8-phosphate phosphatase (KDO 8-P phosphatase)